MEIKSHISHNPKDLSPDHPSVCIICLALSRWDAPVSSPALSLAKAFAKTHRVFYIDHPYSWKDYIREKNTEAIKTRKDALLKGENIYSNPSSLPSNITIVTSKLTIPINFLPEGVLYDQLSKTNDRILHRLIRRIVSDYHIKNFIFINFFDPFFLRQFPADIKPLRTVYQCMDDISQVPYTAKHGVRLENEIVENYDHTICTSLELTRLKSAVSSNVHYLPNAADLKLFSATVTENYPRPKELKDIDKKIIGFTGSIEYRSDFELLQKTAKAHPDKLLVFIGPMLTDEHRQYGLDKLPNVVFIGPRKIEALPAYLRYFDCAIIPYKKNILTKSIYPLKVNEYLAAGKAVIATNFSDDIAAFSDVIYIAESHKEFISAIDRAINDNSDELIQKRIQVAAENSWEKRAEQFWGIVGSG